eukprot:TRINITY_DN27783_c0_g1_i1.p2 TRINITY_DN27783_c0_g1~~TRINITY_DN27783_c0_g1_i1.p2  ORF type:complete len:144 (+),score=15.40 TRINITY_DN27783_c0_g1_i1:52-432(+)
MSVTGIVVSTVDGREYCLGAIDSSLSYSGLLERIASEADLNVEDANGGLQLLRQDGEEVVAAGGDTLTRLGIGAGTRLLVIVVPTCGPCGGCGCIFCNWGGKGKRPSCGKYTLNPADIVRNPKRSA